MRTDAFDFELPDDLIALRPADRRDGSRLLTVTPQPDAPKLGDLMTSDLPDQLRAGDALVFNNTKVLAALLKGVRQRGDSTVAISVNLLTRLSDNRWSTLAKPARRLKVGDALRFAGDGDGDPLAGEVVHVGNGGVIEIAFEVADASLDRAIDRVGLMPLPHYIAAKRSPDADDRVSYQTVFAKHKGAVAAPTAGLHFTDALLRALNAKGVSAHTVTLHVGGGTFLPVKVDRTEDHVMHAEWGEVTEATADALNQVRASGGRIVAVGTTSLRLLETAARDDGTLTPFAGETDIFITPGYRFKVVDQLLTNFHLPKSTLFMLVSAFSGLDTMKRAYAHAIAARYRFYSYGDACLLDREGQH